MTHGYPMIVLMQTSTWDMRCASYSLYELVPAALAWFCNVLPCSTIGLWTVAVDMNI